MRRYGNEGANLTGFIANSLESHAEGNLRRAKRTDKLLRYAPSTFIAISKGSRYLPHAAMRHSALGCGYLVEVGGTRIL